MKYSPVRKRKADKTMTKATKRFKNDTGYDEGDWGRADTKYAPGPTYDHEVRSGEKIEEAMIEKLLQGVLAEAKQKEKCPHCGSTETFAKPSNLLTSKCHNCKKEWPFKFISMPKKANEAADKPYEKDSKGVNPSPDPITDCAVCDKKGHPAAVHLAKALTNIDEALVGPRLVKNGFTQHKVEGGQTYKHPDHGTIHIPNSNGMNPTVVHTHPNGSSSHVGYLNMHNHLNRMGLKEDEASSSYKKARNAATALFGMNAVAYRHPDKDLQKHFSTIHDVHVKSPDKQKWVAGEIAKYKKQMNYAGKDARKLAEDEAVKCDDCGKKHAPSVPCPKKKLLFGGEKSKPRGCCDEATVSPTEIAMQQQFPARPTEERCSCGHPKSFHDEHGCKTCRHSGDYTEKLYGKHSFQSKPSWVKESVPSLMGKKVNESSDWRPDWLKSAHSALEKHGYTKVNDGSYSKMKDDWPEHNVKLYQPSSTHPNGKFNHTNLKWDGDVKTIRKPHVSPHSDSTGTGHAPDLSKHLEHVHSVSEAIVTEASKKKLKLFDKQAHVRALSRAAVGQPPPKSIIKSKKDKPPKHKSDYMNEALTDDQKYYKDLGKRLDQHKKSHPYNEVLKQHGFKADSQFEGLHDKSLNNTYAKGKHKVYVSHHPTEGHTWTRYHDDAAYKLGQGKTSAALNKSLADTE